MRQNPTTPETRAVCLAGGLGLAAFVAVSLFGVVYPFTLEPYEGALLLPALKLSRGETIYGPEAFLKPPFLWTAYGPTYYFLTGMVMKVFGVAFWPGRLLSLFATLGTAAVVFFAVRHLCASRMAAIVSSSVFIMLPTTWTSGALSRVDALGLFFATTGFSLVLCSPDRWGFLAGCAAALAFLTKPTLIAATMAAVLCLMLGKEWRALIAFASGAISAVCVASALLYMSGNDDYWTAQLMNSQVHFAARTTFTNFRAFSQSYVVLAAVILLLIGWRPLARAGALVSALLFMSGILAVLTSARVGSGPHYYSEFGVALAFCSGLGFAALEPQYRKTANQLPAGLVAISLLGQLLVYGPSSLQGRVLQPLRRRATYVDVIRRIQEFVPPNGTVSGEYPELALKTGRQVVMNDLAMFAIGPAPVRRILEECLSRRTVDAWVMAVDVSLPGYVLSGAGFVDSESVSGIYYKGPLLYVRSVALTSEAGVKSRSRGSTEGREVPR